jgi:Thiamine pyrophosphate enzyme, N-terminal TPP binding domain
MSENTQNAAQTGAQLVVRALEVQGVTNVFGVPGAKIDAVFDALVDSRIKTVVCRHEQNAAFIAGGIGRMTGKAGVAIATSGPGVSNLTTGWRLPAHKGILYQSSNPMTALGPIGHSHRTSAPVKPLIWQESTDCAKPLRFAHCKALDLNEPSDFTAQLGENEQ